MDNKEKRYEPIVSGASVKKDTALKKIAKFLDLNDGVSIKDRYIIPGIKRLTLEILSFVLGERRSSGSDYRESRSPAGYIRYDDYRSREYGRPSGARPYERPYDYSEFTVNSYADAAAILSRMEEIIRIDGCISVATLYDLAGLPALIKHTDNRFGWNDAYEIKRCDPYKLRDGYALDLPRPVALDSRIR